jgi:hypothetical protein
MHVDLLFYEKKLQGGQKYIRSAGVGNGGAGNAGGGGGMELLTQYEAQEYEKIKKFEEHITKYRKTFPRLCQYLATMEDLLTHRLN